MRPAPVVPIRKAKHSLAELRFSTTPRARIFVKTAESRGALKIVKVGPGKYRRIAANHPWYRKPRLPDAKS